MASNKEACIHITRGDIRIVEGRITNGVMLLTRTAIVPNAKRFFHGERLAFMTEMVNSIVDAMNVNSFTTKTAHIIYDNGVDVQFYIDEKLQGAGQQKKSLNLTFGKKADGGAAASKANSGTIVHKKAWGRYITESERGELYTTTTIERDLVEFMIDEFGKRGIYISSIEPPETALLYLRKILPYSYDALNKLVVYANDKDDGVFYQFTKDMPAGTKAFHFSDIASDSFVERVVGCIKNEMQKSSLINPYIMLVGDAFSDADEYVKISEALKEEGLFCIDIYGIWNDRSLPFNRIRVTSPEQNIKIVSDGRFGIAICGIVRSLESKPENMIEGFHPKHVSREFREGLVNFVLTVAILFFAYAGATTGISLYENKLAKEEYDRALSITDAQLKIAEQNRDITRTMVDSLATIDSRYKDIFTFVYSQVTEDLNIASIDTEDMIPESAVVTTTPDATVTSDSTDISDGTETGDGSDGSAGSVDVTNSAAEYTMQTIVIRGYSTSTNGPVELYNALVNAGLGEVKIVGVEQVPLPSTETLFAFELTVGPNQGG